MVSEPMVMPAYANNPRPCDTKQIASFACGVKGRITLVTLVTLVT